jgi:probable F420-dependent oxidoreductase
LIEGATIKIGVGLSVEWLADLTGLQEAAVALDRDGFDYVTTGGHLLTARPGRYESRLQARYALPYRDPFVLFSNLAGMTHRLSFRTAILILPMLPTALVAKQAADLSLLTGGRFQLGIGISWQEAEFRALGQAMRNRGQRLEEQIALLRMLWSEPLVTFKGRYHEIDDLGLGQLPDEPIPIWIGCGPEPHLLARAARLAEGWMPVNGVPTAEAVGMLQEYAVDAGRSSGVEVAGRVPVQEDDRTTLAEAARQIEAGATQITLTIAPNALIARAVPELIRVRQLFEDGTE